MPVAQQCFFGTFNLAVAQSCIASKPDTGSKFWRGGICGSKPYKDSHSSWGEFTGKGENYLSEFELDDIY